MTLEAKRSGALILRLIVGLALLGGPRVGAAQGNWTVLATAGTAPGYVTMPTAVAADPAGNLYVADEPDALNGIGRLQKRDTQGSWSLLISDGGVSGHILAPNALAVDIAGNLYISGRLWKSDYGSALPLGIQLLDAQGHWSVIATEGTDPGQVFSPSALALDSARNLYVADGNPWDHKERITKRDTQGNWSPIATFGSSVGGVIGPSALAVDTGGNLYITELGRGGRIQKRDTQGKWSVIATHGFGLGEVDAPVGLAVDIAGNLYVAEFNIGRIQKLDAQGHWSVIAASGSALGQVTYPLGLAVDGAGNLYVADSGNNRVLKYTPAP